MKRKKLSNSKYIHSSKDNLNIRSNQSSSDDDNETNDLSLDSEEDSIEDSNESDQETDDELSLNTNKLEPKILPERITRGSRMEKLIGEEKEADDAFWGQEIWNIDQEDKDYSTEEEDEIDEVDSDFDQEEILSENEEKEIENNEKELQKVTRREKRKLGTGFKDPLIVRASVKKKEKIEPKAHNDVMEVRKSLRASTAMKSKMSAETRETIHKDAKTAKEKNIVSTTNPINTITITQEELILEAIKTATKNTHSLSRLENLEKEKRKKNQMLFGPVKPLYTGKVIRYHSKIINDHRIRNSKFTNKKRRGKSCGFSRNTITFLNTDEYPDIFNKKLPKVVEVKPNEGLNRSNSMIYSEKLTESVINNSNKIKLEVVDKTSFKTIKENTETVTKIKTLVDKNIADIVDTQMDVKSSEKIHNLKLDPDLTSKDGNESNNIKTETVSEIPHITNEIVLHADSDKSKIYNDSNLQDVKDAIFGLQALSNKQ